VGFHWLLIEMGAFLATDPKAIASDRREMRTFSLLLLYQPPERPQSNVNDVSSGSSVSAEDHRLGNFCVVVSRYRLKPHPII
jgi:hypothetical protein